MFSKNTLCLFSDLAQTRPCLPVFSDIIFDRILLSMLARHLKKRVKEHIPTCVDNFLRSSEKAKKSVKFLNAAKRLSIAEHLVNNQSCAENFNSDRFKIIKNCVNIFDLIKCRLSAF